MSSFYSRLTKTAASCRGQLAPLTGAQGKALGTHAARCALTGLRRREQLPVLTEVLSP